MLVTGESGARAAQRGFLPAIFGRQSKRRRHLGLLIVATAMSALTIATLAPTVSDQFEVLIEMVVTLIVVTYGAAGWSCSRAVLPTGRPCASACSAWARCSPAPCCWARPRSRSCSARWCW